MGEIADSMINGEVCHTCGVYIEPEEVVYLLHYEDGTQPNVEMPKDGSGFGVPVHCESCYLEEETI